LAITLGKDASLLINSATVAGVRNVTFSSTARTIDVEAYGARTAEVYSVGQDGVFSMELNDDTAVATLFTALINGTQVTISGGQSNWSFTAVITSLNETAAVDGVVSFQLEARMARSGLKVA